MVLGHKGMVGRAITRLLKHKKYNVMTADLDLRMQTSVFKMFAEVPDYVFICAAKVGGIMANKTLPADFLYDNAMIALNVLRLAHQAGIKNVMFLGSSCIYPKMAPQPIKEEYLLTGLLEPTNEAYAIAKIAGIKMCEAYNKQYGHKYISVMPTNLYGVGDKYDLQNSHVLPALIRKAYEAKINGDDTMIVWGTGNAQREFLYVDDLAEACVHLMEIGYDGGLINIGTGQDVTIKELATLICKIVGFKGKLEFDATKPDGTPRKLLDVSKINELGWKAKTSLADGIGETFKDFLRMYLIKGAL
jgi:GDP-L-fucose synthase